MFSMVIDDELGRRSKILDEDSPSRNPFFLAYTICLVPRIPLDYLVFSNLEPWTVGTTMPLVYPAEYSIYVSLSQ